MTDEDIYEELVDLRQEMLDREETMLQHIKLLHRWMAGQEDLVKTMLTLMTLPDGDEKAGRLLSAIGEISPHSLQTEMKSLLAKHESQHEKQGFLVARMRDRLEGRK